MKCSEMFSSVMPKLNLPYLPLTELKEQSTPQSISDCRLLLCVFVFVCGCIIGGWEGRVREGFRGGSRNCRLLWVCRREGEIQGLACNWDTPKPTCFSIWVSNVYVCVCGGGAYTDTLTCNIWVYVGKGGEILKVQGRTMPETAPTCCSAWVSGAVRWWSRCFLSTLVNSPG